jgi:hypothetical protein
MMQWQSPDGVKMEGGCRLADAECMAAVAVNSGPSTQAWTPK